MKQIKTAVWFFLLVTALAAMSFADNREKPGPMPNPPSILNLASDLDFTAEQITKLIAIEKNSKKQMEKVTEEFRKLMGQMQDEMDKDAPDRAKIDAVIEKISQNHKAMLMARTDDMLAIKAVLTKQQREKMKKMFKRDMKNGHGPGGPEGMMGGPGRPEPPIGIGHRD